jgi:hypothetical protein
VLKLPYALSCGAAWYGTGETLWQPRMKPTQLKTKEIAFILV